MRACKVCDRRRRRNAFREGRRTCRDCERVWFRARRALQYRRDKMLRDARRRHADRLADVGRDRSARASVKQLLKVEVETANTLYVRGVEKLKHVGIRRLAAIERRSR